jgi:hypothetical protein
MMPRRPDPDQQHIIEGIDAVDHLKDLVQDAVGADHSPSLLADRIEFVTGHDMQLCVPHSSSPVSPSARAPTARQPSLPTQRCVCRGLPPIRNSQPSAR